MSLTKKRRVVYFPPEIIKEVEEEGRKRLIEQNQLGLKLLGCETREIICLAVKLAMKDIRKMTPTEFKRTIEQFERKTQ